jgi:protein-S-isoprenylcysteine O-methyltransferase Ste14
MHFVVQYFTFWFGLMFLCIELYLNSRYRNKKERKKAADKNSLAILWITIISAFVLGGFGWGFPAAAITQGQPYVHYLAMLLALSGLALRLIAIRQLGKSFTVDVQIAKGQSLKRTGLYTYIRHPSYTGILMAFTGLAITYANWISLAIILIPVYAAFAYRIRIEEAALRAEFGAAYDEYCRQTKRLIPFVY